LLTSRDSNAARPSEAVAGGSSFGVSFGLTYLVSLSFTLFPTTRLAIMRFLHWSTGRRLAPTLLVFFALAATGCGKTGRVTGTVTFEDKPLPFGKITFHIDGQPDGVGNIMEGKYDVSDAPLGECQVTVNTMPPNMPNVPGGFGMPVMPNGPGGEKLEGGKDKEAEMLKVLGKDHPEMGQVAQEMRSRIVEIPDKYQYPDKSGLKHTVTRGTTDFSFTIEKPAGWKKHDPTKRPPGVGSPR
jgi:hypothetical protein